ncbi:MAG: hypothetical protein K9K93_06455 [Acholeplasmataceae bacterium]|nr:hypothetical protein [Acholeplasmataceae bacterium]
MKDTYETKHLSFESQAMAPGEAMITSGAYRITVMTDRLFRFEYDPGLLFEDRPTRTIWYRNLKTTFEYQQKSDVLIINTTVWTIELDTAKPKLEGLVLTEKTTGTRISYEQFNQDNLGGTYRTLDMVDGAVALDHGLNARHGVTALDDANSVVFEAHRITGTNRDEIDLYVFGYGLDYPSAITDFYRISGRTPRIPKKVLGNWWSRYWNYDEAELTAVVMNFKRLDIPLSVLIIDMDWHITDVPMEIGGGWTGYTWNKDYFNDPEKLMRALKDEGLLISLNLHPADGIRPFDDCYPDVIKRLGLPEESQQVIPFDLPDSRFLEAYFLDVHHPLEAQGVDFWWIDWQQGTTSTMDNLDPLFALNHSHFMDGFNRFGEPYLIFSRYAGPGSHRYPIGFSGDSFSTWASLSFQPYFTATASNIGYGWWSHDIGGHQGGIQDPELYVRWVQYGILSPIMRLHSTKSYYQRREPWNFDLETQTIVGDAMRLRHRLIPYIHTFNHLNARGGLPLIRPLYYTWADTDDAYNHPNQYWFGSELMARPFTSPAIRTLGLAKETIWFKTNGWFNVMTGEHIRKRGTYEFYGTLRDINLYAKAGAIVPMATHHDEGTLDLPSELDIHVFPGKDNTFTLIEDTHGSVIETTFVLKTSTKRLSLLIQTKQPFESRRVFHIHLRSLNPKVFITADVSFEKQLISETNTMVISVDMSDLRSLTIKATSQEEIIKSPYDMTKDIMRTVKRLPIDTEIKNTIGYINQNNRRESAGWLGRENALAEKKEALKKLSVPSPIKRYLAAILHRVIKNS